MQKKFICYGGVLALLFFTMTFVISSPTVSAENSGASKVKQLISSKNFYLEYGYAPDVMKRKVGYLGKGIAVSGKDKMTYGYVTYKPGKLAPEYCFVDGKYFKFLDQKRLIYYTPEQMEDPYINPSDGQINETKKIFEDFLPPEMAMFKSSNDLTFVDSSSRFVNRSKKILSYDRYQQPLKNALGEDVKVKNYYVYYDKKGSLLGVDTIVIAPNENPAQILDEILSQKKLKKQFVQNMGKYQFTRLVVSKFNNKVPKDFKKINKKTKFFEPYLGDMNELIESRVKIETQVVNR